MRYRFLLFDADNTLFDFSRSESEALRETFLSFGFFEYDRDVHLPLYAEINNEIWKELEAGRITQERLKTERYSRFFSLLGVDFSPEEFGDRYLLHLSRSVYLIEGAAEILEYLAGEENRLLSLVTNGISRVQNPRIADSGLADLFHSILISEEIGAAKPQREFFDTAFRRSGNPEKSGSLIIGDNISSDIAGGIEYGIDTCWYNPSGLPENSEIRPTYIIRSLDELKSIA